MDYAKRIIKEWAAVSGDDMCAEAGRPSIGNGCARENYITEHIWEDELDALVGYISRLERMLKTLEKMLKTGE